MSQQQVRRPEVTLTASSAPLPVASDDPQRVVRWPLALLLVPLALLGFALARPVGTAPTPPSAQLVLLGDQLAVTQSGVLVVALEVRNPGDALRVQSAVAYAQPVVDDAVVQAPEVVRARAARRFVTLLAPDCSVLQPGSPLRFIASVQLQVVAGAAAQRLVLDLTAVPVVRDRVASLCRSASTSTR